MFPMERGSAASLRDAPTTADMPGGSGHFPLHPDRGTPPAKRRAAIGMTDVTHFPAPLTATSAAVLAEPDWHVLVLWADDSESDLKGIWGPYSTIDLVTAALEELRQWPLDGRWDVRRLNKFVARKAATKDQFAQFSWQ